jgi:nucleoside phosphorylase
VSDALLVCAALRIEMHAARSGLAGSAAAVARIGMRGRTTASAVGAISGPLALIGFGGGLDDSVSVGDIVVADQIRDGDRSIPCAGSDLLAAVLIDAGLRVRVGSIASSERIVHGAARRELAASSRAIAVDMESAPLAGQLAGRPIAVVRVIVDTPARRLLRPSMLTDGLRGYRTLREIARLLPGWADQLYSQDQHHGITMDDTATQEKVS